jgi:hypothetical protein
MHHLILVREVDQQLSGACGRFAGDLASWTPEGCAFPERRRLMNRVGAVYRGVRQAFGDEVRISVVDPRNPIAYLVLALRDILRHHVPLLDALRTLGGASLATGVFDGQLLFRGRVPEPEEVVERIAGRLRVHRVGAAAGGRA